MYLVNQQKKYVSDKLSGKRNFHGEIILPKMQGYSEGYKK